MLVGVNAWGGDFHYFYRSPKGLLMGDAYTTLATGPSTLFYNPALAVRNNLFAIYPLPLSVGVFDIIDEKDRLNDIDTEETSDFADAVIKFPLHVGASLTPTIKFRLVHLERLCHSQSRCDDSGSYPSGL